MKQISREELEELKQKYKEDIPKLSHRQRAERESEIWEGLRYLEGKGLTKNIGEKRDWFEREFGGGPGEYEIRSTLLNAGAAADPLWERIDSGAISLSAARFLLSRARQTARGKPAIEATREVLERRDEGEHQPQKTRRPKASSESLDGSSEANKFNRRVRELSEVYINGLLVGVDDFIVQEVRQEFLWNLEDSLKTLSRRIQHLKSTTRKNKLAEIGKNRFDNACLKLGIRSKWKKPLEAQVVMKAAKRRRYELHPDRNKTVEAANEFLAVKDAEQLLLDYCRLYQNGADK